MSAIVDRRFPSEMGGAGFSDRAVGGTANPTSVELDVRFEGDEVIAQVLLRQAFEGAPGRAHGGVVAAAFDDVTGFVIGNVREPAFTGELTVRYVAPVPVNEPLEMRARLGSRTPQAVHHRRVPSRRAAGRDVPGDIHHRRPQPIRPRPTPAEAQSMS